MALFHNTTDAIYRCAMELNLEVIGLLLSHFFLLQTMSSTTILATVCCLLALAVTASGIKCWKCGQYSDGVGSITPCANRTAAKLEECPNDAKYCIVSNRNIYKN